jgi:putative ABC transport system permease protein
MNIFEAFRVALTALRSNKLRAVLTMLGIIIGVGSVVGMLAIGNGFAQFLDQQFATLGSGSFYIYPGAFTRKINDTPPSRLTAADAEAILQPGAVPAVEAVAVVYSSNLSGADILVSAGQVRGTYSVSGVTPSYFTIGDNELGAGRYYTEEEERNGARVTLIGKQIAEKLFGGMSSAVGQRITLNGVTFEVIGVLSNDTNFGPNPNPSEWVFVPYRTARNRLFRNRLDAQVDVTQITVKAHSADQVDEAIEQVTALLRQRHRLTYQNNGFTIINPDQIAAVFNTVIGGFSAFLGMVGGISLLVGGIGIMNIMLVSVTERTREIGLRKAVGARRWDIMLQFLTEAVVLCLFGGALGIGLGYLLSLLGTFVLEGVFEAEGARATVTMGSIILATAVSTMIGVCFGFFPALQASRLNPIEALRYE